MKKLLLSIIILISMCQAVYSKSPTPFIKFETGKSTKDNIYFVESILGFKWKFKEFESQTYGGFLNWSELNERNSFSPFMIIYSFNQKFIYKNWFIRYRHYCAHPVTSGTEYYTTQEGTLKQKFKATPYWWGGTMETLSIGFEYEFK